MMPRKRKEDLVPEIRIARDRFLKNLASTITDPIWLVYLREDGQRVEESFRLYEGGDVILPPISKSWGKVSHVAVIVQDKTRSRFRIEPKSSIVNWSFAAHSMGRQIITKMNSATFGAILSRFHLPFR